MISQSTSKHKTDCIDMANSRSHHLILLGNHRTLIRHSSFHRSHAQSNRIRRSHGFRRSRVQSNRAKCCFCWILKKNSCLTFRMSSWLTFQTSSFQICQMILCRIWMSVMRTRHSESRSRIRIPKDNRREQVHESLHSRLFANLL